MSYQDFVTSYLIRSNNYIYVNVASGNHIERIKSVEVACKTSLTKKLNDCTRENVVSVTPSS